MRRALLSGLVVTAVSAAGVVVSGAAAGEPAPAGVAAATPGPNAGEQRAGEQSAGTKTVTYRGLRFTVPANWPVYDLKREPSRCVRFDVHAVYLGHPGPEQACPARVRGRTDAVLVEPLATSSGSESPSVHHLAAPDPDITVRESVSRQEQVAIREAGVLMTVTYGESQAEAQKVVRSARLAGGSPHPSPTAATSAAEPSTAPSTEPSGAGHTANHLRAHEPGDDADATADSADDRDAAPQAPPMDLSSHDQPLRAPAGPLGPPRWVLGWSPYGVAWYAVPGHPGPRRERAMVAPRPAPAPAPRHTASARPHPTVTVTRTVIVPPPSEDRATPPATPSKKATELSTPSASPSSAAPDRSGAPHASRPQAEPAPDDDQPPLPKPGVSYSKQPDDHSAEPEPAKNDKNDKNDKKNKSDKKNKGEHHSKRDKGGKTELKAARLTGKGFDACTAPSVHAMRAWHGAFQAANIYIGGAARACGDGNLSRSWVRKVRNAGWKLIPTYVGLQAPCGPYGAKIDPKKARKQGRESADDAISEAKSFGLTKRAPLYFDMEGYNSGNKSCRKAVVKFIDGWTDRLHQRGHIAGVYGSVSSTIADLGRAFGGSKPDGVWFAHWDGKANTTSPYMRGGWWADRQRIKQYRGSHYEKHGGVRLNIDSNRVDGYVY